ncbi:MAG TPA: hypothetical protein VHM30_10695, partial [Gemmatimonadaceae bacterium]|nr:hypothetical protein [Gemmatimonadaceae bacterium]
MLPTQYRGSSMLASLARLFQLRPILTTAILGIPVILLIMIGLFTVFTLKFLVFVALPVGILIWLLRKIFKRSDTTTF